MFLDQVTETTESETVNKGDYCNYFDNFFSNSVYSSKTPESWHNDWQPGRIKQIISETKTICFMF